MELIAAGTDGGLRGSLGGRTDRTRESAGNYREVEFKDGVIETIGFR
jgi:hypothetical protein